MPQTTKLKSEKCKLDIVNKVEIPRSLTLKQKPINSVDLHIFGDASILGYCAVAYAVVSQPSKVNQGLVASKSRLAKKDTTIPRLELIATHMHFTSLWEEQVYVGANEKKYCQMLR